MKSMFRFGLIGFLVALAPFARGQFSISDDFSVSGTGNWGHQTFTGPGAFDVTAGVLNYKETAFLPASGTSTGYRDWIPNTGSYAQNWQVQIDFSFSLTQVNEQISSWSLYVGNLHDLTDNLHAMFLISKDSLGNTSRTVAGQFNTDGAMSPTTTPAHTMNFPSDSMSFQASYLAATHTLSLAYDADGSANGYSFTNHLTSAVVDDPSSLNWDLSPENSFGFRIVAENTAGANATTAIAVGGMYADNFAASSIPEPATYATAFGILALLAAGWRQRQQ